LRSWPPRRDPLVPERVLGSARSFSPPAARPGPERTRRALLEAAVGELQEREYREATLWTATWSRSHGVYESSGWTLDGAHCERPFAGATYTEVRYRIEISPGTGSRPVG
jgi:hypothetical protein